MLYQIDDLFIDGEARRVWRQSEGVELPGLSFDLLYYLVTHAPEIIDRETVTRDVWKSAYVSDDTITQRIVMLRKALGDNPKSPRYIRTVRGGGYAIIKPVQQIQPGQLPASYRVRSAERWYTTSIAAAALITIWASFALIGNDHTQHNRKTDHRWPSVADTQVEHARRLLGVWRSAETDEAISILEGVLETFPDHTPAILTQSFALSTRETKFGGNITDAKQAETLARAVLENDSSNHRAWHALAYALDAQSKVSEALKAYRRAYTINPKDITAMSSAANLLRVRGRLSEALILDAHGRASKHASIFSDWQIAEVLQMLGDPQAEHWWQRAEHQNLFPDRVRLNRLTHQLQSFDAKSAADRARQWLSTNTPTPRFARLLARTMLRNGDKEQAKTLLAVAADSARYDRAALMAVQGQPETALQSIAHLQERRLAGDSHPETRLNQAELTAALGHHVEAMALIEEAINLGWRDIAAIESSPFLSGILLSPVWLKLKAQIEEDLFLERIFLEQSPSYALILANS